MQKEHLARLKNLKVLFVEDETGIRENIVHSLRYMVDEVIEATNGKEGLEAYYAHKPDIVFTDILMPVMDGIELVRAIRKNDSQTCAVIITAHTDKEYLLKAVDLHLEHYIVKPVNLTTLTDALLRCAQRISSHQSLHIKLPKDYTYDVDHKELCYKSEPIKLTKKEVGFLELLLSNTHRVVTYQELQDNVWQDDVMTDSALRSLVRNLRKKLPSDFITNLSGVGYKIALD